MKVQAIAFSLALVLVAQQVDVALSSDQGDIDFPLVGDIQGSDLVLDKKPTFLLVGETHGTMEIPLLVAVVVRSVSSKSKTLLCLEIPIMEQERLDEFINSDGGSDAVRSVLSGPHWMSVDGRAGKGHFALLELSRRLFADGRNLHIAAIDIDPSLVSDLIKRVPSQKEIFAFARKRDQIMAKNIQAAAAKYPKANIVVLAGNVHTRLQEGTPWDAEYKPMGLILKQLMPGFVSLNTENSGGHAWVSTDRGIGPTKMIGKDRGPTPFVKLFPTLTKGYNGILYVGPITAAPPVHHKLQNVGDGKN